MKTPVSTDKLQHINSVADLWRLVLEPQRLALQVILEALGQSCAYILIGRRVTTTQEAYGATKTRFPSIINPRQWTLEEGCVGYWIETSLPVTDDYGTTEHVFAAKQAALILGSSTESCAYGVQDAIGDASTLAIPQSHSLLTESTRGMWIVVVQGTTICKTLAEIIVLLINNYYRELELREAFGIVEA